MKNIQNNIKSFIEALRNEKKTANSRIENIQNYSGVYRNLMESKISNIKNLEEKLTTNEEKILSSCLNEIDAAKEDLAKALNKQKYTSEQSEEIVKDLKKLLKLYNSFFDNGLKELKTKKDDGYMLTLDNYLSKNNFIGNEELKYDKGFFYYNLSDFSDEGYTINFEKKDFNTKIQNISKKSEKENKTITSDSSIEELICGFKKIMKYYNDTNSRTNVVYNDASKIIKEIKEKLENYKKLYNKSYDELKKNGYANYRAAAVKQETAAVKSEQEYITNEIENKIKNYLGVLEKAADTEQRIKLFFPKMTNDEIEKYTNGEKNNQIEEIVEFIKSFLKDISGVIIDNYLEIKSGEDYDITPSERNEGLLVSDNENKSVTFKVNDKILENIEFHTNEKSLYMSDESYVLNDENNEIETKWKVCDNIARNNYKLFTNKNYESLKKLIQEVQGEEEITIDNFFININQYQNNGSAINNYYENYKIKVSNILDEKIEIKKEEYNSGDDKKKEKIVNDIVSSMSKYLLIGLPPTTYLKDKGLEWCQDSTIKNEVETRLKQ